MTTDSSRYVRAAKGMKFRVAATLLLAGAVLINLVWTGEAWGQAKLPGVGVLTFFPITDDPAQELWFGPVRRTLADRGWIEDKTVSFEYRNAGSDPARIAKATAALVALKVDVIFATSAPMVRAAYAATRTIPIAAVDFTTDPIAEGYVQSYARPGGNVTGVFLDAPEFAGKWFELLTALVPDLSRVSVLWDPGPGVNHLQAVRDVAGSLDIRLQVLEVRTPDDINAAFDALHGRPQAVIFLPSPMIYGESTGLARLALKYRLPATSMAREFADAGGTLAYGPDRASSWDRSAELVAKILAGSNPAELPVERPTKIQLLVNLKTAKSLGFTIPQWIILRADEVIR